MHGRPRRAAKPEDEEASSAKAAKLRDLQAQVLQNQHSGTYTKEAIGLSFKLLEINPEAYTAWNYRKLAFQHNIKELSEPEAIKHAGSRVQVRRSSDALPGDGAVRKDALGKSGRFPSGGGGGGREEWGGGGGGREE
nr:unnamed protein product [Digitaria exilis]CAB3494933.1 unnamed protein product [Digitaria exilis]CAB3494958.1 unnamed protein product [Digitaria exilis]